MELTTTRQSAGASVATDVTDEESDDTPDDTGFEGYECTAREPLAPTVSNDRLDLKTRVYAVVVGVMSFGGIGWICLCIGAGLNFLFS